MAITVTVYKSMQKYLQLTISCNMEWKNVYYGQAVSFINGLIPVHIE